MKKNLIPTLPLASPSRFWRCCRATLLGIAAIMVLTQGVLAGNAVFTTTSTGSKVNANLFDNREDVYLNGGPTGPSAGLAEGTYYFEVTIPNSSTLLSTDNPICRLVTVDANGKMTGVAQESIDAGCAHFVNLSGGNSYVQLFPFDFTTNPGGEYKVTLTKVVSVDTMTGVVTLSEDPSESKSDNFKVRGSAPTGCGISVSVEDAQICITEVGDGEHAATLTAVVKDKDGVELDPNLFTFSWTDPDNNSHSGNPVKISTGTSGTWTVVVTLKSDDSCTANTVAQVDVFEDCDRLDCLVGCPDPRTIECGQPLPTDDAPHCSGPDCTLEKLADTEEAGTCVAPDHIVKVVTQHWRCKDPNTGLFASCDRKVTIVDTTPPAYLTDPGASGTVECPGTPEFTPPTASDVCGTAHINFIRDDVTPLCGSTYSVTRVWDASDDCGNHALPVSQTITVVDTTPPTLVTQGSGIPSTVCGTYDFTKPTFTDLCDATPTVSQVGSDTITKLPGTGTYKVTRCWKATDDCLNDSATTCADVIVKECRVGTGLTIGYWQNKNGQAQITGTTGCLLSDYLRTFGTVPATVTPFQDLALGSKAAAVATYVNNVIKAANASGATMNAMLKAQMLATALDVYFSPGKSLGDVHIDLTAVNKPIGSGSYESTLLAFNNVNCQTVNQLLIYASSQLVGGVWYGGNKSTQELAKDTFDAINNNVAFICP